MRPDRHFTRTSAFAASAVSAASGTAIFAAIMALTTASSANPRPLPFSYPYETIGEDKAEIEQYVDATYLKKAGDDGKRVFDARYRLQTEFEYGITDHLELGLYMVFAQGAPTEGDPTLKFDGTKQRLRYRIAEEGDLPVDMALYFEVAEFHDELEFEQKVILQKRFGNLKLITNLWVEQSLERGKSEFEFAYNPTVGATYQLHPKAWIGAEYWLHGTFENEAGEKGAPKESIEYFNAAPHHFAGPTFMLNLGKFWWSNGAYLRLDRMSRSGEIGDKYGKLWIRSVLGIDL